MRARTTLLIFAALAVLHTWPLASAPGRLSLNHNADAQLNEWALAWIARTLPTDPLHLFDTNIFAPEPRTLTYTDPLVVPALFAAPFTWLGGSPVLAFNMSLLAGLTLTGWAACSVAARWTGSTAAGLVAGALAAFNPHLLTRLPHIVAAHAWTIPLALYLADGMIESPRPRRGIWLALVVAATAANSIYSLALVGLVVGIVTIAALLARQWRAALAIGTWALAGLALAAPLLVPYLQFAGTGASRPIETIPQFSATVAGYLHSPSLLHGGWSAPFFERDVSVFFAGFTAIALAIAGLLFAPGGIGESREETTARAARSHAARRRAMLAAMAVVGFVLSLGPATPIYVWLYDWVPPLRGLRAAARFGYLYLIGVAFAAAFGVAWLAARPRWRPRRVGIGTAALVLVTIEAVSAPIRTTPFAGVPPIYTHLAEAPGPVTLVEMPFWPPEAVFENGEYVLNSTAHWRPLMNGYSGFTPDSYRRRANFFWYFPEARALDRLRSEGATHVMVHLERFTPQEVAEIERVLRERPVLQLVATDSQGHRLYLVR